MKSFSWPAIGGKAGWSACTHCLPDDCLPHFIPAARGIGTPKVLAAVVPASLPGPQSQRAAAVAELGLNHTPASQTKAALCFDSRTRS